MNSVPFPPSELGVAGTLVIMVWLLVQATVMVLLVAVGAWLAIRFEKWREARQRE